MKRICHFVYILECKDGTYYTGYTIDVEKRLKKHEQGKGAKYTRGRAPFNLLLEKGYETKEAALKAEYAIKKLSKQKKVQLIYEERCKDDVDTKKFS